MTDLIESPEGNMNFPWVVSGLFLVATEWALKSSNLGLNSSSTIYQLVTLRKLFKLSGPQLFHVGNGPNIKKQLIGL